jgi:ribose/xylose/arabinose/galactoside ABC-type transport system permease subunit
MELDAIAAVVIGGTLLTGGVGNVIGIMFGVLITRTIISILQFNETQSSWWTRIVVGVLTLIFIGIQSLCYMRNKASLSNWQPDRRRGLAANLQTGRGWSALLRTDRG